MIDDKDIKYLRRVDWSRKASIPRADALWGRVSSSEDTSRHSITPMGPRRARVRFPKYKRYNSNTGEGSNYSNGPVSILEGNDIDGDLVIDYWWDYNNNDNS